jgi:cobalt-zinc-cadmium efflux system membrane fusion protein
MKQFIIGAAAVAATVGALATAGVVAGRHGWQPPTWLGFLGGRRRAEPVDAGLFCREHGVPEKFCTLCHEELKSKLLMCAEHGVPEEVCTICHHDAERKYGLKMICREHGLPKHLCPQCNPALRGGAMTSDWCPTHGVPESLCTRCKPDLARTVPMCAEHDVPEAVCTICRPELVKNFATCPAHQLPAAFCPRCRAVGVANGRSATGQGQSLPLVRLADAAVAASAGITTEPVQKAAVTPVVVANGEVGYDENRLAHVRARLSGVLHEVRCQNGESVEEGRVLAVIDSAELGQAKADYLAAKPMVELWSKTLSRVRGLNERGIVAEKQILEAETDLQKAKAEVLKVSQRLRNFGLDDAQLARLADEDAKERNLMSITAPLTGTLVRRKAVPGEAVDATSELFTVADLSQVWVYLDLYEKDLRRIRIGQPVTFRVPGLAPAKFVGMVSWIDTEVNDRTRTIRVRATVDNKDRLLLANMFGRGEIQVNDPHTSLVVPRDAVQWVGLSFVVFVQRRPGEYEPRRVLVGQNGGTYTELAWSDLQADDDVVTTGSFLLKAEVLKGTINAGCCVQD